MNNNLGYGDNIPINVNKSHKRNFIVRCFSILVLLFACAFLGYCVFNSQKNVNVSNMLYVYADSYSQPDTWIAKTWTGLTDFSGQVVWSDGVNYYYSNGVDQYVLDVSTSTWSAKTWTGYTSIIGNQVWSDGVNYYYSNYSEQYVLDVSTSTWSAKTWTGYTSFLGNQVWSDGVNYYLSNNANQYVLDVSTSTWSAKTWTGLTNFNGNYTYYVDDTVYYSYYTNVANNYELVKDVITPTIPDVPAFTVSQDMIFVDLKFDDDLDTLSIYSDLVLDIWGSNTDVNSLVNMYSISISNYNSGNINFTKKVRFSFPVKYLYFNLYYLSDSTNHYEQYYTMQSFTWNIVSAHSIYSGGTGEHSGFDILSDFSVAGNTLNFDTTYNMVGYQSIYLEVYDDTNLVYSYRPNPALYYTTNVNPYYMYGRVNDTVLELYKNYRARFIFSNNSITYGYLTSDWRTYLGLINTDYYTGYTSWFFVPYTLSPPVLTLSDYNVLSWNNVAGASYYFIVYDNTIIENHWIGTSYTISSLGDYYVVAYSDEITIPPAYSNTVTVTSSVLDTPVISLSYANITWDSVDNAGYYVLYILDTTDNEYHIVATNITSTGYTVITTGTYVVRAVSNNVFFTDSSLSNSVYFEGIWTPGGGSTNSLAGLIGAVVDTPVHYIVSFLDFDMDFLGFNMLNLVMTLFTLCAVIFIVKFILGRTGKKGD